MAMASQMAASAWNSCLVQPKRNIYVTSSRRKTVVAVQASVDQTKRKLLCFSNGHGEDEVAASILKEIICIGRPKQEVEAMPLVGMGQAYKRFGIATIGPSSILPSGGFSFRNNLRLLQDVCAGLMSLIVFQWKTIEAWVIKNPDGVLLAVGDAYPLLLAWTVSRQTRKFQKGNTGTGVKFIFVGTAKSEYYLRDDNKSIPMHRFISNLLHNLFGWGAYFPWERAMMADSDCCLIVPRDSCTVADLKKTFPPSAVAKIKDLGNPMMDNLKPSGALDFLKKQLPALFVALLPGSRAPEVYFNWKTILDAVEKIIMAPISDKMIFIVPVFPLLEIGSFSQTLLSMGWKCPVAEKIGCDIDPVFCEENIVAWSTIPDGKRDILHSFSYKKGSSFLILTRGLFPDVANLADVAIAMAGTATEQLVGLGKPVFTIPGKGPQFTYSFAEAQSRLLGKSIIMCSSSSICHEMVKVLNDERYMDFCKQNGVKRMGVVGASHRIAQEIHHLIWNGSSS